MQRLPLLCRSFVFSVLQFFLLLIISAPALHAQASPTASKPAAASVFAAYSLVSTDRKLNLATQAATNSESTKNSGFTFGADISLNLPHGFISSLEGRITLAPGSFVSENTYGGGARLERRFQYFHPYVGFIWSYGTISFTPTLVAYKNDNSKVYTPTVGLDYNVSPNWAGRVDYQYQFWNTGTNVSFNPQVFTIGVVYRIPFHSYQSR